MSSANIPSTAYSAHNTRSNPEKHNMSAGRKEHICPVCGARYSRADHLVRHTKSRHPQSSRPAHSYSQNRAAAARGPSGSEGIYGNDRYGSGAEGQALGFKCEDCGKVYMRKDVLRRHRLSCPGVLAGPHVDSGGHDDARTKRRRTFGSLRGDPQSHGEDVDDSGTRSVSGRERTSNDGGLSSSANRVARACKRCAAQKLKCDEIKPCKRCVKRGISCEVGGVIHEKEDDEVNESENMAPERNGQVAPALGQDNIDLVSCAVGGSVAERVARTQGETDRSFSNCVSACHDIAASTIGGYQALEGSQMADALPSAILATHAFDPPHDLIRNSDHIPTQDASRDPTHLTSGITYPSSLEGDTNVLTNDDLGTYDFERIEISLETRDRLMLMVRKAFTNGQTESLAANFISTTGLTFLAQTISNPEGDTNHLHDFIHFPTLSWNSISTQLFGALIASACVSSPSEQLHKFGYAVQEAVRFTMTMRDSLNTESVKSLDLQVLQAFYIQQNIGLWSTSPQKMKVAEGQSFVGATHIRQSKWINAKDSQRDDTQRPYESQSSRWMAWIEQESWRRVVYYAFRSDCELSLTHQIRPSFSISEMRTPLPSCKNLWAAKSAEEWNCRVKRLLTVQFDSMQRQVSLADVVAKPSLLQMRENAHLDTDIANISSIYGFWTLVWEARQLSALKIDSSIFDTFALRSRFAEIRSAIQEFGRSIYDRPTTDVRDETPSGNIDSDTVSDEVFLLIATVTLHLHVSISDLLMLARTDSSTYEMDHSASNRISQWLHMPDAYFAIHCAGQILRAARRIPKLQLMGSSVSCLFQATLVFWGYSIAWRKSKGIQESRDDHQRNPNQHSFKDLIRIDSMPETFEHHHLTSRQVDDNVVLGISSGRFEGEFVPLTLTDKVLDCIKEVVLENTRGLPDGSMSRSAQGVLESLGRLSESRWGGAATKDDSIQMIRGGMEKG